MNTQGYTLREEMFHAYQDTETPGGIEALRATKGANIEFEAKVFNSIISSNNYPASLNPPFHEDSTTLRLNYHTFIYSFTAGGTNKYPKLSDMTGSLLNEYYDYIPKFKVTWPQYATMGHDRATFPSNIFNLTSSSTCPPTP